MKKTKKALASLAIAGMTLSMIPFNVFAASPVTRIAGVTAEQTAVQIAEQTGYTGTAILASSTSYGMVDALTAGPLAASLKAPILLTGAGSSLDAATKAELTKLAVKKVYVTSGTAVIKQSVVDELKGMGIEVEALGGYDRAETSVNIAKKMTGVTKVAVANTVVDALSIAAVASAANEPILLTDKDALPASVAAYLAATAGITASDVIGGTGVISDAVKASLPSATRHAGMSAYDTNNQVIQNFAGSLQFDTVYVANGVTGIDALAGAPLAAQTKSPIVLTDGKTVPQAAAFTYSKAPVGAVVTALGGEAVVSESVRAGVAAGSVTPDSNELKIVSVSALDEANKFLQIDFSKAVTKLEISDISIQDASTLARYGVKSVTLAASGLAATVELYGPDDAKKANPVLSYLTNYTVTVFANGTTLKTTFNRPYSLEVRVQSFDVSDKEIKVLSTDGTSTVTLKVLDPKFDYAGTVGEKMQVWFNKENELIKSQVLSTSAITDAIEITDTDEIKLITENKKYDISTETYTAGGAKFKFFLNGSTTPTTITAGMVGNKYAFAKINFDKSGDIEYVSAYDLKDFLIVDSVDNDEVVGYEGVGTGGSFDASDATIVKGGKVITLADLKKGDVLYFNDTANNNDGFAEVYSQTVTGEIDTVYDDAVLVNGKTYSYSYSAGELNTTRAVYINNDGDTAIVDSDAAEDLQAAGAVTLHLNRAGHLVYIAGDVVNVATNKQTAILTENAKTGVSTFGKHQAQISAVLETGDTKVYDLTLEDLDQVIIDGHGYDIDSTPGTSTTDYNPTVAAGNLVLTPGSGSAVSVALTNVLKEGQLVKFHLNDNGSVKKLELFTANGTRQVTDSTAGIEAGDKYISGKKLLSTTLVFDANKGYANTTPWALGDIKAGDVSVIKWGDYKGSDISHCDYIVNSDNEVVALVIRATTTSDTVIEEAVITKILRNSDHEVTSLSAYVNGEVKTYDVDSVANTTLGKGDVAILELNKNTDLVEVIRAAGDSVEYAPRVKTGLVVSSVNVGEREVTFTNGDKYKLVSEGKVLNGTDNSDITVKTLADLRGKTNVTLVLDEKASGTIFAKYFMWETNVAADTTPPTAGTLTNQDLSAVTTANTYLAGDTITITFSEDVNVANLDLASLVLDNGHTFDTDATVSAVSPVNGFASSFVITLGTAPTVAAGDTITINKAKVTDVQGNAATGNAVFTVTAAN
ncbi:cell wall-binding repeat-containing protein [Desulfosporosinus sp. HMP52]|uniref:cell wall-binding repeat-containing protein n=1 Tax=Desulfosporosinus sp. HMP52 TaxID=1487923 RepID=UPI0009DF7ECE|nr:cell wall-binding repeat-containing protein [Desulfosporosinus sp. HMP52]